MTAPLDERHCRAAMPGRPDVLCGRHTGHAATPGDGGHRQRGADGGLEWRDPPTPVQRLAALCKVAGYEELPGRLGGAPPRADIRRALATLRAELDEIERELGDVYR